LSGLEFKLKTDRLTIQLIDCHTKYLPKEYVDKWGVRLFGWLAFKGKKCSICFCL